MMTSCCSLLHVDGLAMACLAVGPGGSPVAAIDTRLAVRIPAEFRLDTDRVPICMSFITWAELPVHLQP